MKLKTAPVLFCRVCGEPLVFTGETFNDPNGDKLNIILSVAEQYALCEFHRNQMNYYASIGRLEDWLNGRP